MGACNIILDIITKTLCTVLLASKYLEIANRILEGFLRGLIMKNLKVNLPAITKGEKYITIGIATNSKNETNRLIGVLTREELINGYIKYDDVEIYNIDNLGWCKFISLNSCNKTLSNITGEINIAMVEIANIQYQREKSWIEILNLLHIPTVVVMDNAVSKIEDRNEIVNSISKNLHTSAVLYSSASTSSVMGLFKAIKKLVPVTIPYQFI